MRFRVGYQASFSGKRNEFLIFRFDNKDNLISSK